MPKLSKNQSISSLLWLWQKSNPESGNTLVIAISLGLLFIAATTTAIISSTREKTTVNITEASVQAVEVAELGVTKTHNFLAQNPQFALAPKPADDQWDYTNLPFPIGSIPEGSYKNTSVTKQTCANILSIPDNQNVINEAKNKSKFIFVQDADDTDKNKGTFILSKYELKKPNRSGIATSNEIKENNNKFAENKVIGFGELTLQSTVPISDSHSQVKVTIPLKKKDSASVQKTLEKIPLPGVWLGEQNINSAQSSLDANLMVKNCDNINLQLQPGREIIISSMTFPKLPAIPSGISDLGDVNSEIYLPQVDGSGIVTDIPIAGEYNYIINTINLQDSGNLNIIPGYKVNIYLKSSAKVGGTSTIVHKCADMTVNGKLYDCDSANPENAISDGRSGYNHFNLKIFGYGHSGTSHVTENVADATFGTNHTPVNPELCLSGNQDTYGFIFAPQYSVGVADTGNHGFLGALWVKNWQDAVGCSANTSQVASVSDDWNSVGGIIPQDIPPLIDSISKWEREKIN